MLRSNNFKMGIRSVCSRCINAYFDFRGFSTTVSEILGENNDSKEKALKEYDR